VIRTLFDHPNQNMGEFIFLKTACYLTDERPNLGNGNLDYSRTEPTFPHEDKGVAVRTLSALLIFAEEQNEPSLG